MNVNKLGFKTLTTYLMAKETHSDDKEDIALRIVQECSLGYEQIDWVMNNNWIGGESSADIIKAWKGTSLTRLERANEVIKLAYELADQGTQLDEIEVGTKWVNVLDIKRMFEQYLDEFDNE